MPFYEYQCSACGRVSEVMQKVNDPALKKCPSCGKSRLQKLVSAPVFRLKGSGWYETDFKGDKDNKRNLAAGDAEPQSKDQGKDQGKDGGKDEGKPAAAEPASGAKPEAGDVAPKATQGKSDSAAPAKAGPKAPLKADAARRTRPVKRAVVRSSPSKKKKRR